MSSSGSTVSIFQSICCTRSLTPLLAVMAERKATWFDDLSVHAGVTFLNFKSVILYHLVDVDVLCVVEFLAGDMAIAVQVV